MGNGTLPLLDDVNCQGVESNLFSCSHNGIGQSTCNGLFDVAGVICQGMPVECIHSNGNNAPFLRILYQWGYTVVGGG